ncbi:MAG: hypothetical protein ACREGA_01535 [Candidatus Saccharimonadales bacterium]
MRGSGELRSRTFQPTDLEGFYGAGDYPGIAKISRAYLDKHMSPDRAYKLLAQGSPEAKLQAGEIALESAYAASTSNGDDDLDYLEKAQIMFKQAGQQRQSRANWFDKLQASAELNQIQLVNHAAIILNQRLPAATTAEPAYNKTVNLANKFQESYFDNRENLLGNGRREASGLMAEMAVMLLGQRLALREIGVITWMMLPSLFSENHQNHHGSTVNRAWDLSVFDDQMSQDNYNLSLAYRIQVKNRDTSQRGQQSDAPGISLIQVSPDLALYPNEAQVAARVIGQCYRELVDSEHNNIKNSEQLDARQERLIDKL